MGNHSDNSKRIVKNTLFLYLRHLFIMFISFFSARIVLDKLGVVDFGIQNVVGGMASLFTFFRTSLSNATQRFLSIAIGRQSEIEALNVFKQHQSIYIVLTATLLFLFETIGLYFFYHKLVIPQDRLNAAFWVYQFTVISLCVTLLSVAYDAVLVAHENMKIYSYIGIYEAIGKLLIAFAIAYSPVDRLISYAFLLTCIAVSIRIFYTFYCKRYYQECSFHFLWNKKEVKDTFSFISWNFIGTAVWAINNNGIDILLNIFFGPAVNAAKGVANQVCFAITNFSNGFLTSVQPQLIKTFAAKDFDYLYVLFFRSSKYSFLLLWLFCFPFFFVIDDILNIWLKNVPNYASSFVFLILLYSLVNSLNQPIWILAQAVGKLKWYICIGSGVFLMVFPVSYLFLNMGFTPNSVFKVNIVVRILYLITVFMILRRNVYISCRRYFKESLRPIFLVVFTSALLATLVSRIIVNVPYAHWTHAFISFFINICVIAFLGLSNQERSFVVTKILRIAKR